MVLPVEICPQHTAISVHTYVLSRNAVSDDSCLAWIHA